MIKKNNTSFISDLIHTFPEIEEEVLEEDWLNLISLQIGCFSRFTQKAVDNNNIALVIKCFQFADDNINIVESNIENSLAISWLGKLNFDNNKNAYQLLSPKLIELYVKLQKHYTEPSGNEKFNKFLRGLK
jgi:hypothetical protein